MVGGMSEYKAMPINTMQQVVDFLSKDHEIVQLGARRDILLKNVHDQRGLHSFRATLTILYHADLFIGSIGALVHFAASVNTPSVVAYSAEPDWLVKYPMNRHVYSPRKCTLCEKNVFPTIDPCRHLESPYYCIRHIRAEDLIQNAEKTLSVETVGTNEQEMDLGTPIEQSVFAGYLKLSIQHWHTSSPLLHKPE